MMKIKVDGYNINYKLSGEGEKYVVILQGWGTTLSVYDSVAALLTHKYKVLQLDFPGFGESDEPKEPWSVEDYAEFTLKLLKALSIDSATLIGHSYGGRVIIRLAAREKLLFNIERIVLIDSAGVMPVRTFRQKLNIRKYKLLKGFLNLPFIYPLFKEMIDEWRQSQGSADYRNASPMMKACMVKAVNEDLTGLFPKIKQEVLLIWGDMDTATPLRDARIMEEKMQDAHLAVIKGTGHFSFLEAPGVFAGIMKAYFG